MTIQEDYQLLLEENERLRSQKNEMEARSHVAYKQNFEQFRHLNTQMNAVPTFAMTLTGGLWFGAGLTDHIDPQIRFALLIFAGIANVCLALIAIRIRDVMQSYLEQVKTFFPPTTSSGSPQKPKLGSLTGYSMISIYCLLMLTASGLSFFGAIAYYWPSSDFPRYWGIAAITFFLFILAGLVFGTREHLAAP